MANNSLFIGQGDVSGPASATDGAIALFDGTTGKLIKDGGSGGGSVGSLTVTGVLTVAGSETVTGVTSGVTGVTDLVGTVRYPLAQINASFTDATAALTQQTGLYAGLSVNPGASWTSKVANGAIIETASLSGNAQNLGTLNGMQLFSDHRGTGTLATLTGAAFTSRNTSTGAVTNLNGITVNPTNNSTGNVSTRMTGVAVTPNNSGGATIAELLGVRVVPSQSGTSTVSGELHYFDAADLVNNSSTVTGKTVAFYAGDITAGTQTGGAYGVYISDAGALNYLAGGVRFNASTYANFGATDGTGGYGFRDLAGAMQFKDSGGAWTSFNAGASTNYFQRVATLVSPATSTDDFTVVGTGTSSIRIGVGALNPSDTSIVIGNGAISNGIGAAGVNTVLIAPNTGVGSGVAYGDNGTGVGAGVITCSTGAAMGSGADNGHDPAVTVNNVNIGDDSKVYNVATTTGATAIGRQSVAHTSAVAAGRTARARATQCIGIGTDVLIDAAHTDAIVLGYAGASTAASQFVLGSTGAPIRNMWLGQGPTSATALSTKLNFTDAVGADISTGDVEFNVGRSTGSGVGGILTFQSTTAGASSSSLNSLVARLILGTISNNTPSSDGTTFSSPRLRTTPYTVAGLPASPTDGMRGFVTDANGPTYGAAVVGGGAVHSPVFYSSATAAWMVG